jgi:hypothetical protein
MSVIREAIRETLNEFEPEVAIKFIDKLNSKIANLSYRPPKQVGFNEIRSDVRMLSAEIEVDQILDEDEDE